MEQRSLGANGPKVSVLGFGCGAVGGLMVRGGPADQERAVARAIELGVNYFDTAADYGHGQSEINLGRVLKALKPDVLVGTKLRIPQAEHGRIAATVIASLDASLQRLGRDSVDLYQLHNAIRPTDLTPAQVLGEVIPALQSLQRAGKTRYIGITALGDTDALREVINAGLLTSAQVPYNLLNPSGDAPMPPGTPGHDFQQIMRVAKTAGTGVIGIRVLAAGALSGEMTRHPIAAPNVAPIASGASYADDVSRAHRFLPLVAAGHVGSLVELALRYVLSSDTLSTVLIGMSTISEFQTAASAILRGPLSAEVLREIKELQGNG